MILRFRVPVFVWSGFDDEPFWSLVHHCLQTAANPSRTQNHPDPRRQGWYDIATGPVVDFWWQRSTMAHERHEEFWEHVRRHLQERFQYSEPGAREAQEQYRQRRW